jgi:hypothetical protein
MTDTILSERECLILAKALIKCRILWRYVGADIPVNLNQKNFGFPEMTDDEEIDLIHKLYTLEQLAFLKETKNG